MNKRNFLKGLLGVTGVSLVSLPVVKALASTKRIQDIPIPRTADELYDAANKLFDLAKFTTITDTGTKRIMGHSNRCYDEELSGKRWVHKTYGIGIINNEHVLEKQKKLVRVMWNTFKYIHEKGARKILWRRIPTFAQEERNKYKLTFRCSFDKEVLLPDESLHKKEGKPVRFLNG